MAVVKNMIVRVGADLSGLISGFKKGGGATGSFAKQASDALRSVTLNQANLKKAMAQGGKNAGIVSLVDQIRELEEEQKALKAAGFSWGYEGFEQNEALLRSLKAELQDYIRTQEQAGEAAEETARKTSRIGTAAAAASSWLKKAGAWILNLGSRSKSSSGNMESLVRSIRRIGIVSLGLSFTRAIFGELSSIVHQYVSENAALQAQVNTLKSSLGQALAPAINLVTNALSKLMPYVVGVSNAIGSLITNLFGSGWTSVAAGADAAAAAIGGAGSAQEEFNRTLQGFDEITKLDSKSSGGGGGAGSSGAATAPVEGKLPAWMTGLTDKVQKAIQDGDWFGVSAAIAKCLNNGLDKLTDADVSIGTRIAGWINNGLDFVAGFIETTDWEKLRSSVAKNLEDLIYGIDWNYALSGLGAIGGAAVKWIADGLSGIWTSVKDYFNQYIKDAQETYDIGNDIGLGIITGLWDAFVNVGSWVKENILTPLVNGFKSTFDIHSPSTNPEITGIGKNIMLGIFEGLLEPLKDPIGWIKEHVFTPLSEGFQNVFGGGIGDLFSGSTEGGTMEMDVQANFTKWKDELRNKVIDFQSRFTSWKDNLKNKTIDFQSRLTTWKDSLRSKVVDFQSNLTTWKDSLRSKVVDFQSNLTTWKDSLQNKAVSFQSNLTTWKDSLQNKAVSFQSNLTTWKDSLQNKAVSFQSNLTTWKDSLQGKAVSFQSNLTTWKDNLKDKLLEFGANVVKGWNGTLEDYLGISNLYTKLNVEVPEVKVEWKTSYSEPGNTNSTSVKQPVYSVMWNATGAILTGAQLFGRAGNTWLGGGEAGREAVLPLDRNTWWMDKIADRVALKVVGGGQSGEQSITVNLVVDGKILASTVVRHVNAQARATGRNPLAAYM